MPVGTPATNLFVLVITLELALYSNVPQKLLMAFRMSILVPPRSMLTWWCLSPDRPWSWALRIPVDAVTTRRCPWLPKMQGHICISLLERQAVSHCPGWEAHSLPTLGWQHRRILWKDSRESLDLQAARLQRLLASGPSVQRLFVVHIRR